LFREAWTIAIRTLSLIEKRKISEHLALARIIKDFGIINPDSSKLAHQLVYETIRRKNLIDKFINKVMRAKSINDLGIDVQSFLRIYVYSTRFSASDGAVNFEEASRTAKLARSILGWRTIRQVEPYLGFLLTSNVEVIMKGGSEERQASLRTFHPEWFVKYCFELFGREQAIAFLKGNLHPPPTYIRINTLKASETEILESLTSEGFSLEKVALLKNTYQIKGPKHPSSASNSYKKGLFFIQDKASCFAAEVSDPKPGAVVLDICAAPGAKTTYLAQLMSNDGVIFSIDYSARRMRAWRSEVSRLGVNIANGAIADACVALPFGGEADLIVLDPPCTSTGVFGRLPSAKWRLNPHSIQRMAEVQWRMINNCSERLRSGGFLVYATCSITEEENELVISRFLQAHPEFNLVDTDPKVGVSGLRGLTKCQRLYPHIHQSNGFFIAKLMKK
jgi:16S rRNA (cytosine967-C5)-methyltransferase